MNQTIVIHQPDFIPYLGFFQRLLQADVYVVLDHVCISKRGWVHRDKIKTPDGEQWITVPVHGLNRSPIISEATIDHNHLYHKIARVIEATYRTTPHFDSIYPTVSEILARSPHTLMELNVEFLTTIMRWLNIDIPMIHSSSLNVKSLRSAMNAELVQRVGGTTYLSGIGARDYHEQTPFDELNIKVIWQQFTHPTYPQMHGKFIPFLSTLDALFNCGIEGTRKLIREC